MVAGSELLDLGGGGCPLFSLDHRGDEVNTRKTGRETSTWQWLISRSHQSQPTPAGQEPNGTTEAQPEEQRTPDRQLACEIMSHQGECLSPLGTLTFQRNGGLGLQNLCKWDYKPEPATVGILRHPLALASCELGTRKSPRPPFKPASDPEAAAES